MLAGVVFSIPAGPLDQALLTWSMQARLNLVYVYEHTDKMQTPGFTCEECSPLEALQGVVVHLPLTWELLDERTLVLTFDGGKDSFALRHAGWGYYCTSLELWSGALLNRAGQVALRVGKVDLTDTLLCYPSRPLWPAEAETSE